MQRISGAAFHGFIPYHEGLGRGNGWRFSLGDGPALVEIGFKLLGGA